MVSEHKRPLDNATQRSDRDPEKNRLGIIVGKTVLGPHLGARTDFDGSAGQRLHRRDQKGGDTNRFLPKRHGEVPAGPAPNKQLGVIAPAKTANSRNCLGKNPVRISAFPHCTCWEGLFGVGGATRKIIWPSRVTKKTGGTCAGIE